jgi:hypothetical protein
MLRLTRPEGFQAASASALSPLFPKNHRMIFGDPGLRFFCYPLLLNQAIFFEEDKG